MSLKSESPLLHLGGVRCRDGFLETLQDGRILLQIPHQNIQRVALRRGPTAKHPLLQISIGIVFVGLGLLPLIHLLLMPMASIVVWRELVMLFWAPLGGWVIWEGLHRGDYLEVQTSSRSHKLAFKRGTKAEEIEQWIAAVAKQWGLSISRDRVGGNSTSVP